MPLTDKQRAAINELARQAAQQMAEETFARQVDPFVPLTQDQLLAAFEKHRGAIEAIANDPTLAEKDPKQQ